MTPLAEAVARSGLLTGDMIAEMRKWGLPIPTGSVGEPFQSVEDAVNALEDAVSDKDMVEVKYTDLDILKQYLKTMKRGKLHLVSPYESGTHEINYGYTKYGDRYIIPWHADSIEEIMTNGETHLMAGRRKIYFTHVEEFYFGEVKAFMVCTPALPK